MAIGRLGAQTWPGHPLENAVMDPEPVPSDGEELTLSCAYGCMVHGFAGKTQQ